MPLTKVDDFAENVVAQQISQIAGVAQVTIGGQQRPAIRVQVDPAKLTARGLTLEDVRSALANATTDAAKGTLLGRAAELHHRRQRPIDQGGAITTTSSSPIATARRFAFATSARRSPARRT